MALKTSIAISNDSEIERTYATSDENINIDANKIDYNLKPVYPISALIYRIKLWLLDKTQQITTISQH